MRLPSIPGLRLHALDFRCLFVYAAILTVSTGLADPYCLIKFVALALFATVGLLHHDKPRTPLCGAIAIYLVSLAVSTMLSQEPWISLWGQSNAHFTGLVPMMLVAGLFYAAAGTNVGTNVYRDDRVVDAVVTATTIAAAIGIAQKWGLFAPYGIPWGRIIGTIGSPVFFSCYLAMAVPLAVHSGRYVCLGIITIALLLTVSRSGWLGAGVGTIALWACSGRLGGRRMLLAGLFVALATLAWVKSARPVYKSDLGRKYMTEVAMEAWKERPAIGHGPEIFYWVLEDHRKAVYDSVLTRQWGNGYTHNQFLEALSQTGLIGLLAHLLLVSWVGFWLWKEGEYPVLAAGLAMFVYSMFQPTPLSAKGIMAVLIGSRIQGQGTSGAIWPARAFALAALLFLTTFLASSRIALLANGSGDSNLLSEAVRLNRNLYR